MRLSAALLAATAATAVVAANVELISGPGAGLTTAKCSICHDNEHIARSKLTREEWEDNLRNMLQRGMPPLTADETRVIVDYLTTYYGPNPPPAPSADTLAAGGGTDPVARMLDKYACSACHAVDRKLIGPAFRDVAAKYAGDGAAAPRLAEKLRYGGQGVWGNIPMPPNPAIPVDDQRALVAWVLRQR